MKKQRLYAILSAVVLFVLIIDAETVALGALNGVELCIYTVIPSLFPLLVISGILSTSLFGLHIPVLSRIGVWCGIPKGCEFVLMISLLSGYPVGAKTVSEMHKNMQITRKTAVRMLGFCNNCGPAFIFGICANLFTNRAAPFILWIVQALSAIITAILLPKAGKITSTSTPMKTISISYALRSGMRAISEVCGWVVLFRVFISLLERWVLWRLPQILRIAIIGLLELTNGCTTLSAVGNEGLRFVLCGCMLTLGGICVLMQTISVTDSCGLGLYLPGKFLQCAISGALSIFAAWWMYSIPASMILPAIAGTGMIIILLLFLKFSGKSINKDGIMKESIV